MNVDKTFIIRVNIPPYLNNYQQCITTRDLMKSNKKS